MKRNYLFRSERLGFRHWQDDDVAVFTEMNRNPDVMEYFPKMLTPEETAGMVERIHTHFREHGYGLYAVDILATEEFIGYIGFTHPRFHAFFTPCIEIGWRLKKSVWGQGYATEGAIRCLQFGFHELQFAEVYSFTAVINHRSENVMKKAGMEKVDAFEHPAIEEGNPLRTHVLYNIAADHL
ncbi:MAG TPA: GNAT family N-acetyltransferase [Chitinophaga sp.]|uniref:GNAT family N-acetyltransferase n=1 Tax=Chitinophaga sp. TaxID=1869181 RepID=UPI002BABB657|nr:GNAT family N-acetyltransferase [Chitinophaga sp.]HVI48083.1 GNAT family N-acetyltransferase [Chitinophaga sp.]